MRTVDIVESSKDNILRYSKATFLRAFGDYRDGLKPIHRRILYLMHLDKVYGFTKVATLVGRIMKFHPHGDSSVYGALVRMGQPWVMNYTYIDGQGNFGTQDGDPPAAGRYIEAKLSEFAKYVILDELDNVAVNYSENYDYTCKVPDYLTSKIPLILINGINGIGEAYRTYIPPHNLNDVADRCIAYIRNKNISNEELCDNFYPDFPTGGEILNGDELADMYKHGKTGIIQIRGKAEFHPESNTIIMTEFPYGIDCEAISKAVTNEVKGGNMILSGIESILDNNNNEDDDVDEDSLKSNKKKKNKTTYEYACKKEANLTEIFNEICRCTQFKTSIALSFMTTSFGYPKYVTVKDIIEDWYNIRVDCKQRRHKNNIAQAVSKMHLYEGVLSIYDRLDEVINVIRKNKDGKDGLIRELHSKFGLTIAQSESSYGTPLGTLSSFGKAELISKIENIKEIIEDNEYVLSHIDETIIGELETLKSKYGRPRRTTILKDFKLTQSERPVLTKGMFLYSKNVIGLYDSNGCRDSKSLLTGMRPYKNSLGRNIKEIIGGCSIENSPIAFAVCYSDSTIQRIDSSVFKILNAWYDTKCDEKTSDRYITSACPIFEEDDEIICISDDLKLKRISVSELNKRAVGSGNVIVKCIPRSPKDPDRLDYMIAATSVNKNGEKIPSYSIAPIEDIPLVSRSASGVKCAYSKEEIAPNSEVYITLIDMNQDENTKIMIGSTDSNDNQNYIYGISANELSITGRTNKPKALSLPKNHVVSSVSMITIDNKEQVLCMVGINSSSTLNVTNFKKPFVLKKVFLTTKASIVL